MLPALHVRDLKGRELRAPHTLRAPVVLHHVLPAPQVRDLKGERITSSLHSSLSAMSACRRDASCTDAQDQPSACVLLCFFFRHNIPQPLCLKPPFGETLLEFLKVTLSGKFVFAEVGTVGLSELLHETVPVHGEDSHGLSVSSCCCLLLASLQTGSLPDARSQ